MTLARTAVALAGLLSVYGFTRYLDELIRIFLRQRTGEGFLSAMARNLRGAEAAIDVLWALLLGFALWTAFALVLARLSGRPFRELLPDAARPFAPLSLGVALSALASISLMLSPAYPYGLNLALTLAYEGSFASLLISGLVLVSAVHTGFHAASPDPRLAPALGGPRLGIFLLFLALWGFFAFITPDRFWQEGVGQGNTFKYQRMAAALAGSGTLDIAEAERGPETATLPGFLVRIPSVVGGAVRESLALAGAVWDAALRGEIYLGEVEATRANRAMFRSPEGGVYYINAPGPGILLVPAYLADATLNRALGSNRQVAMILFWNLLTALLVIEMVRSARAVSGSTAAAIVAALALATAPPLLFYSFQIYPEIPAALLFLYSFRKLVLDPLPGAGGVAAGAAALAFLPWLHQKYAVAAAVLGVIVCFRFLRRRREGPSPTKASMVAGALALSGFSLLVYNHALTGSLLPDATFRAAGRSAFEPENAARGLLGLLFDAENGLLIYAPIYAVALVGARKLSLTRRSVYVPMLAVVLSFLLVIASFPYWPGAVSTIARYILSVAPFAAIPLALVVRRAFQDGTLAGVTVLAAAGSLSVTLAFHRDLVQSYHPSLLLSRTLHSDPYQYLPNFLSDGPLGSGPAHFVKLGVLLGALALLVGWLSARIYRDPLLYERDRSAYARRATGGAALVLLCAVVAAAVLEKLPTSTKKGPVYRDTRSLAPGSPVELSVEGKYSFEGDGVWVPGRGTSRFLLGSPHPLRAVQVILSAGARENRVVLKQRDGDPLTLDLPAAGVESFLLPLQQPYLFEGPAGKRWVYSFTVSARDGFVPRRESGTDDGRYLGCFVRIALL